MESKWYVLHTLAGQELRVRESIEKRAKIEEVDQYIDEVLVPMEKVTEVKGGRKVVTTRKLFPGYVFIRMKLFDDSGHLLERPWRFVRETQGVIGFVGDPPVPTPDEEVERIKQQIAESEEIEKPKISFEIGETVKIREGPFENFTGVVEEIDYEHGKLKVSVNIFGRNTPVELEFWQVDKV